MKFRLIGLNDFGHGRTLEVTAGTEEEARGIGLREAWRSFRFNGRRALKG